MGLEFRFDPTPQTAKIMAAMGQFEKISRARNLVWNEVNAMLDHVGQITALRMKSAISPGAQPRGRAGSPGKSPAPIQDIKWTSRMMRSAQGQVTPGPLSDQGKLADIMSWRVLKRSRKQSTLLVGPIGTTPESTRAGVRTLSDDEEVSKKGTQGRTGSIRTVQELAFLHENGFNFRVTAKTLNFFSKGIGQNAETPNERKAANALVKSWAARMGIAEGEMSKGKRDKDGFVDAEIQITVPPRPFMRPAIEATQGDFKRLWPQASRRVFLRWTATTRGQFQVVPDDPSVAARGLAFPAVSVSAVQNLFTAAEDNALSMTTNSKARAFMKNFSRRFQGRRVAAGFVISGNRAAKR